MPINKFYIMNICNIYDRPFSISTSKAMKISKQEIALLIFVLLH